MNYACKGIYPCPLSHGIHDLFNIVKICCSLPFQCFFVFILLEVCWALEVYRLIFSSNLRHFDHYFLKYFSDVFSLYSPLGTSITWILDSLYFFTCYWGTFPFFKFPPELLRLYHFYWSISSLLILPLPSLIYRH